MTYLVKEIFYSLQGEGANVGRAAVFCRFAGCNLWSGRDSDRASAVCQFCDTDFAGTTGPNGGRFATATELANVIAAQWPTVLPSAAASEIHNRPLAVLTGGEPLLQVDPPLLDALHAAGFAVAVETNGTTAAPVGIDWICVSPKAGVPLVQRCGQELKLVFPQIGAEPQQYEDLDFVHFFLQPMDGRQREANTQAALQYCLSHPRWRLSLQIHKVLGIS